MSDPLAGYGGLPAGPADGGQSLAYFVSAHGFGHATRACAVMAAIRARRPDLTIHVFTQAPEWLFAESVPGGVSYHSAATDVGVVQHSALSEWMRGSLKALPIIESVHVMAVAVVYGTILLVDLRLMGLRDTNRPFSRVFFTSARSHCAKPGPRMVLRPQVPIVPGATSEKTSGFAM